MSHGPARSSHRILTILASLLALAATPAAAQEPGVNLLANGDAEAGTAAPDSSVIASPPLWMTVGEFTQVAYGAAGGFPDTAAAAAIGGGKAFFAGGNTDLSAGTQTIDVSSSAGQIDAGGVVETLSALLGGFGSQEDNAAVYAAARDAGGNLLGDSLQVGPVTAADRNSQTTLVPRQASAPLPAGTRTIEVNVISTRIDGSYNDGYADNVSLTLGSAAQPKAGKSAGGATVTGTVLVRRPGTTRYVALGSLGEIPVGTIVDATKGAVQLKIAVEGGKVRTGIFAGGIFKFTEPKEKVRHKRRFTAHLAMRAGNFAACKARVAADIARKRVVRYLAAQASGRFRVIGKNSSGVERGTTWTTYDRCDGTLTAVAKDAVVVTDFAKHKNVVVKAGHSYLARARG